MLRPTWVTIEMRQDALDHRGIFDTRNHLHLPAAGFAGLNVYLEYALQTLCPCHRRVAIGRRLLGARRLTATAMRRRHLLTQMMIRREDAVIAALTIRWVSQITMLVERRLAVSA